MPQLIYKLGSDPLAVHFNRGFETTEERSEFVKDPAIWWYYFPEDDAWKKGAAWNPPAPAKVEVTDDQGEDERW